MTYDPAQLAADAAAGNLGAKRILDAYNAEVAKASATGKRKRKGTLRLTVDTGTLLSEKQVQASIVKHLRLLGYRVNSTVHIYKRVRCDKCGAWSWPKGGYGSDKAIGDLLVRHPSWPAFMWLNADVKTATGKLTTEQEAAVQRGELLIWRSSAQAEDDMARLRQQYEDSEL